mmetsp:Transcript_14147/g.39114  ORF Transcript_14147/g.39114 Transcript_14147/m.39114 type:complete len:563 (-) Transcript_14147:2003-3691(-)
MASRTPDNARLSLFLWGNGDNEAKQIDQELSEVGFRQVAHGRGRLFYLTSCHELKEIRGGSPEDSKLPPTVSCTSLISHPVFSVTSQSRWGAPDYYAAITSSRHLYTWGDCSHGQLGHGNKENVTDGPPKKVQALAKEKITQIACGGYHALATTMEGRLFSWGYNGNGRTGQGLTEGDLFVPKIVSGLKTTKVKQVSAGLFHSAFCTEAGELFTFGYGGDGRLGLGNETNCLVPTRVVHLEGKHVAQVSCGSHHTALITKTGSLYSFGKNEHGLLGHGDEEKRLEPTFVRSLESISVSQVSCGNEHSVALSDDGQIYTWGRGTFGELGHGTFDKVMIPTKVLQLKQYRVVRVEAFERYTAALVDPDSFGPGDLVPTSSVLYSMVNNQEFADVMFLVDNEPVYGHRAILTQRCQFFNGLFTSGMKESATLASSSCSNEDKAIPIHDIRREIFLMLLEYLYTDAVLVDIDHAIELYCAADMYGLPRLKNLCLRPLKLNMTIATAAPLLQSAANSKHEELKEICMDFVVSNFCAVSKDKGIEQIKQPELLIEIIRKVAETHEPKV